jgi:peptide deformylase
MILPILKIANKEETPLMVLRQTSADVTEFNEELRRIVAGMIETLLFHHGVGLSAPQIGRNLNLFVMRKRRNASKKPAVRVVINPKTLAEKGEDAGTANERLEGCLSIPGVLGSVIRCHEVDFVYRDENGRRHKESLRGMEARVYQHEGDHLCGVLFVDKAKAYYPVGHRFVDGPRTLTASGE